MILSGHGSIARIMIVIAVIAVVLAIAIGMNRSSACSLGALVTLLTASIPHHRLAIAPRIRVRGVSGNLRHRDSITAIR